MDKTQTSDIIFKEQTFLITHKTKLNTLIFKFKTKCIIPISKQLNIMISSKSCHTIFHYNAEITRNGQFMKFKRNKWHLMTQHKILLHTTKPIIYEFLGKKKLINNVICITNVSKILKSYVQCLMLPYLWTHHMYSERRGAHKTYLAPTYNIDTLSHHMYLHKYHQKLSAFRLYTLSFCKGTHN